MAELDHMYGGNYASKGAAATGVGFGIAGTVLGLMNGGANILGLGNGCGCGNGWGRNGWGNNCGCGDCGGNNAFFLNELAGRDSMIAALSAERSTDSKILDLYKYFDGQNKQLSQYLTGLEVRLARQDGSIATLAQQVQCLQNTLNGLTETVIPAAHICPRPMDRFNSWVAPTTPAPTENNVRQV